MTCTDKIDKETKINNKIKQPAFHAMINVGLGYTRLERVGSEFEKVKFIMTQLHSPLLIGHIESISRLRINFYSHVTSSPERFHTFDLFPWQCLSLTVGFKVSIKGDDPSGLGLRPTKTWTQLISTETGKKKNSTTHQ